MSNMEELKEANQINNDENELKDTAFVDDFKKEEQEEEDEEALPHSEFLDIFEEGLALMVQDPLLCDLPIQVTLEEVNSQVALEYGQAMTVRVCKADGEVMPIVVVQSATVLDLKKAIRRYMELKQQREGGVKHISWKYVWRTFNLVFNGEKLEDDKRKLKDDITSERNGAPRGLGSSVRDFSALNMPGPYREQELANISEELNQLSIRRQQINDRRNVLGLLIEFRQNTGRNEQQYSQLNSEMQELDKELEVLSERKIQLLAEQERLRRTTRLIDTSVSSGVIFVETPPSFPGY
ncbi:uncharacterized protein LOC127452107 isoform X3 [Myxocyprinus asiaticus]|nr:uncharacterized protein LOC127452107 isoform X3 [Myxocyprinus asiaticus]